MSTFQKCLVFLSVAALLVAAWMGRYSLQTIARGGDSSVPLAYVLDRWTGGVEIVVAATRRPVKRAEPEQ